MSGQPSRLGIKYLAIVLFLVSLILSQTGVNAVYASTPNTSSVAVSPGKSDLLLGNDFPTFNSVKLSYPDSAILTNTIGDLLFSVRLNPLMLNPISAQVGSLVQIWGSGFSLIDTTCTLSGTAVSSPAPCTISQGILTDSFTVADVPAGTYTIIATGNPGGDFSSNSFTVLSPLIALNPSSGPFGTPVTLAGSGFLTNDIPCTITGTAVGGPVTCSVSGHSLSGTFVVANVPPSSYSTTATGNTVGDAAGATFQVTTSPQYITLSAPSTVPSPVTVNGFHFSSSDTSCTLSGSIIASGSASCSILLGGSITGNFAANNVPAGVYTVTATGTNGIVSDSAMANFLVLPSPPSIPISEPVSLVIDIPPEFTGLTIGNVWSSFTNDYDSHSIRLSRLSSADQVAPNWWQVNIQNITVTHSPESYSLPLVSHRIFIVNQTQYIRLFQVTSPTTAGRYFFKAFINGASIGAENFPTLVVKASRDPAYISGVLCDLGDRNPSRAGQPIFLAPGTGAQIIATGYDPLGRSVSAQTFINSTANGSYTLFGVAAGTYNLTVYAAGYIPLTITQFPYPYPFNPSITKPTPITVAPAQSLEGVDICLSESPTVTGTVLSQTATGAPIPWGTLSGFNGVPTPKAITVQLVNLDDTTVVATNVQPFGFTAATNPTATDYHFAINNSLSSWNGEIPQDNANFTSGLPTGEDYFVRAYVTSYVQLAEVRVHVTNATLETEVPVPLIRTGFLSVTVHFKDSNVTGSDLGICIEQNTGAEDCGDPIKVSGTLSVSAYDMEGILRAQNSTTVLEGSRSAYIELLGISSARQRGIVSQFSQNYGLLPGTYYLEARFTAAPPIIGNAATTTNAPIGTTLVVGDLYYQYSIIQATIGLGEGDAQVSFAMYRSAGVQLHIYSIDTELPPLHRDWAFPSSTVLLTFIPTSETSVYQTNSTQPAESYSIPTPPSPGLNVIGFQPGSYDCFVYTLGYTQQTPCHFTVQLGANADASVWMIVNPFINLTVAFRHEGLLTAINSADAYAQPINDIDATPTRWEVFDDRGNFVAAHETYIPNNYRVANFILAGFNIYYGDPRYVWSGFYDTTDQAGQRAGGLLLYPWELSQPSHEFTIRVWVDGYYQLYSLRIIVPTRGNVSVTVVLDRASRISGTVAGPDFYDIARPLSWATVDLEPYNYTLSGIIDVEPGNYTTSSLDGSFQVWVPQGVYGMGVSLEGYQSYEAQVAVPSGSDISTWIWLDNYQLSPQPPTVAASISAGPSLGSVKGFSPFDREFD